MTTRKTRESTMVVDGVELHLHRFLCDKGLFDGTKPRTFANRGECVTVYIAYETASFVNSDLRQVNWCARHYPDGITPDIIESGYGVRNRIAWLKDNPN